MNMTKKLNHSIEKSAVGYAIYDYPYSRKIYTLSARKKWYVAIDACQHENGKKFLKKASIEDWINRF